MTSKYIETGLRGSPSWSIDSASGPNGRYETVNGVLRDKWNNYSKLLFTHTAKPAVNGAYSVTSQYVDVNNNIWGVPDISNTAQNRLLSKVRSHDFNLAIAVAEGRQTVELVVKTADTLGRAAQALKRGRFNDAARILGGALPTSTISRGRAGTIIREDGRVKPLTSLEFSQKWLELQFGWRPLIDDVHEAAKAFEALSSGSRSNRYTAKAKNEYKLSTGNGYPYYVVEGTLKYKHRIVYELSEMLTQPRALGLLDPASVVWERIPFSFIADWFIPIGTYLENLNQIPHLQGRFLSTTTWDYEGESRLLPPGYTWNNIYYGSCKTRSFSIKRVVTPGLAVAMPSFKSLPKALSPLHVADAIALLRQRFHS